jgi:tetratricopeptide (TPR) repeat protein
MSRRLLAIFTTVLLPSSLLACLWDYDTLMQERSRFPDTLELITGKFLRHSYEFYSWRIHDREEKLRHDSENLAYYDDLAVAYEKTGQHDKAIEIVLAKEKKKPGLYETEANLGTFLIHAGRPQEGLPHIDRALALNPDAHFGREKYQKLLVEYVLERRRDGATRLPLAYDERPRDSFVRFLRKTQGAKERLSEPERKAAIRGVLGMMRFGDHESPVLLEALANLLSGSPEDADQDAKQLAARAYLKASYVVTDEKARQAYRGMAQEALTFQSRSKSNREQLPLDELEKSFREELAQAQQWYEELHQREVAWIQGGEDPERAFARLYTEEPQVQTSGDEEAVAGPRASKVLFLVLCSAGLVILSTLLAVGWWRLRRVSRA